MSATGEGAAAAAGAGAAGGERASAGELEAARASKRGLRGMEAGRRTQGPAKTGVPPALLDKIVRGLPSNKT